nr:hypothetical protein L195_g056090 [Ipomoea batatas]
MSMCFILSWKTWFSSMAIADLLSQNVAAEDERETITCFFDHHEISAEPKNTQKPVMDLRVSEHDAHFEFENKSWEHPQIG